MSIPAFVIIGACQAGVQVADSLRAEGYQGGIVMIGDEPDLPYQRPPLSKDFLSGKLGDDRLPLRNASYYEKNNIETRFGRRATAIDRAAHTVPLDDGSILPYAKLALTTGTRPRMIPLAGSDLDGVCVLRTKADVLGIRRRLDSVSRLVIVGGGFIGLEVAAVMRELGKEVVVLEARERLMPRVVSTTLSDFYKKLHDQRGVRIILNAQTISIDGNDGKVVGVTCANGESYPADLVLMAIGVVPNDELAREAGIACDNGIVVDDRCRTSDPDIVAAGDVANHFNRFMGGRCRLESVQNAADQGRAAAASMVGKERIYDSVPWFWSDQYDVKLQMTGCSNLHEQIVLRGNPEEGKFTAFYFNAGKLTGANSISSPGDHIALRRILGAATPLTPDQAADPTFDLRALARPATPAKPG